MPWRVNCRNFAGRRDAHVLARPHPGAGTTKCAMDAECLADSIASLGIDTGLANYQRLQGAFGAGLVRQSQHDGSYLTDQHRPREQRRNRPELGRR